ncbi:hypothetical protein IT575_05395 [bacterium]|nr:hypothetical protein [bacterium]
MVLPAPLALPREAGFSVEQGAVPGAGFNPVLPTQRVTADALGAQFNPVSGKVLETAAFASYQLTLPDADKESYLYLLWQDMPAAGVVFIGLSNWSSGRWDWRPASSEMFWLFESLAPYTDAQDRLQLVVLLLGDEPAQLNLIQFTQSIAAMPDLAAHVSPTIPGLPVNLEAGPGGNLQKDVAGYEWDLDGDGSFNSSSEELAAQGMTKAEITFEEEGDHAVGVRLVKTDGAKAVRYVQVKVQQTISVDFDFDVEVSSIDINRIDGHLAMTLHQYVGNIVYASAMLGSGGHGDDWVFSPIRPFPTSGAIVRLLEIEGRPAVFCATQGSSFDDLEYFWYMVAAEGDGSKPGVWTDPDSIYIHLCKNHPDSSKLPCWSVALINGCPAMAFQFHNVNLGYCLYYTAATTPLGASVEEWSDPVLLDQPQDGLSVWADETGIRPMLAEVAGSPAVLYGYHHGIDNLGAYRAQYLRSADADGHDYADWHSGTKAVNVTPELSYPDQRSILGNLVVVDGHPAICYFDWDTISGGYALDFRRAASTTGISQADWSNGQHIRFQSIEPAGGLAILPHENGIQLPHGQVVLDQGEFATGIYQYISASPDGAAEADWQSSGPVCGPLGPLLDDQTVFESRFVDLGGFYCAAYRVGLRGVRLVFFARGG